MRIQYKIVIPFTLLFLAATILTALVSISLLSRTLESRFEDQLDRASRTVSRGDFAQNPSIIQNLKFAVGVDVVTFAPNGTILATTLVEPADHPLLEHVIESLKTAGQTLPGAGERMIRNFSLNGSPYKAVYRALPDRTATFVAVVVETSEIARTQSTIARTIFLISILIVALTSAMSHLIARSVTSPVLRLVEFTRTVARGDRTPHTGAGSTDEIGKLSTAFNEMIDQLRRSEEKLLQSEKLAVTGVLAARVAHDIRNPLSAIKMQAQLLRTKLKPGIENENLLQAILREIDRVEWVVRGLLDLARPGELHVQLEQVDEVVDEILRFMEPQFTHRKIAVVRRFSTALPGVMLDRNRLKQALLNLLVNADEAMPNGGTLTVGTGLSTDRMGIQIVVADTGVGIDPEVLGKLFDPFVSTKREGIGLGLVNTKNIVELHDGTIHLEAGDSGGVQAVITLPVTAQP